MRRNLAVAALCLSVLALSGGIARAAEGAAPVKPDWDQVANIKDAAARIAKLQRVKGVEAAYKFIDACYRTHSIAEKYTAGFEACMTQDYLQTKMLVQIYARTPPAVLKRMGSPTPQALADGMGRRMVAAFTQYKIGTTDAQVFKENVDKHGLPVFVAIVFPDAVRELKEKSGPAEGQSEDNGRKAKD